MRRPVIAGNWKMHKTTSEAVALATELVNELKGGPNKYMIAPSFTSLDAVSKVVKGSNILLGAQNMSTDEAGAHTGEVSVLQLKDLGVQVVILGHSERRQYFGETDAIVNRKTKAALASSLHPIVCVGETLQEREAGKVEEVITTQVKGSLAGLSAKEVLDSVIAYEPVWAIGTGKTATSQQAQDVHALIRKVLAAMFDATVAQGVRIQYGGSVKASNAKELFGMPDIDGGLIGGAALDAKSFIDIVRAAV